jgi:hypothetical protein
MAHKYIKEEMKMKFRKLAITLLIGVLSFVTFASTVNAAESDATITFIPGDEAPPVLDPTDPEDPYDYDSDIPGDPNDLPTNETGPLTLDYVSSVEFGERQIQGANASYEATTLRPFIQVSDRRGTGAGWNVTAVMSTFQNGESTDSLPSASLTFTGGVPITVPDNVSNVPDVEQNIVLEAGGDAETVVTADINDGLGSWITRWYPSEDAEEGFNDNVTLQIPAGSNITTENAHTATITWTLTAGPGQ